MPHVRPAAVVFTVAAATVIAVSCFWAWRSATFWTALPLYSSILAAGLLALLAIYSQSRRLLKAFGFGASVALLTLGMTALITLVRWGN